MDLLAVAVGLVLGFALGRADRWIRRNLTLPRIRELTGREIIALLEAAAERRAHEQKPTRLECDRPKTLPGVQDAPGLRSAAADRPDSPG